MSKIRTIAATTAVSAKKDANWTCKKRKCKKSLTKFHCCTLGNPASKMFDQFISHE